MVRKRTINVSQIFDKSPIHTRIENRTNQGAYFIEKLIFLKEIVGILLIIKKPINPRLIKFKYGLIKIS